MDRLGLLAEQRLKIAARRLDQMAPSHGMDLLRLRRQVAFDRLVTLLFAEQKPLWLLKGVYSLELRLGNRSLSPEC